MRALRREVGESFRGDVWEGARLTIRCEVAGPVDARDGDDGGSVPLRAISMSSGSNAV